MNPSRSVNTCDFSCRRNFLCIRSPIIVPLCQLYAPKPLPNRLKSSECFAVSRRKMHPDAPDILPALVAHPVEMSKLHCVVTVLSPPVAHVGLSPASGIQPLGAIDARLVPEYIGDVVRAGAIVVVTPTNSIPVQRVERPVRRPALGVWIATSLHLTHNLVAALNSSLPELIRHCIHRVTVESVCSSLVQQLCQSSPRRLPFWSEVLLPRLVTPQHSDSSSLELPRDPRQRSQATGDSSPKIPLIAIVNAHVRVARPQHHRVDSTISSLQIVEKLVDSPLVALLIVQKAIPQQDLGLHIRCAGPVHRRILICLARVIGDTALLSPPLVYQLPPLLEGDATLFGPFQKRYETIGITTNWVGVAGVVPDCTCPCK
mmetsp:Transcript_21513/g.55021  ORF Transcript_21513/g.55021 Transcript_21513/m.55021 type:complete len:373 (-) Transcript_21513:44-1162(-)